MTTCESFWPSSERRTAATIDDGDAVCERERGSRSKNCIVKKRGAFCVQREGEGRGEGGPVASIGLQGVDFASKYKLF